MQVSLRIYKISTYAPSTRLEGYHAEAGDDLERKIGYGDRFLVVFLDTALLETSLKQSQRCLGEGKIRDSKKNPNPSVIPCHSDWTEGWRPNNPDRPTKRKKGKNENRVYPSRVESLKIILHMCGQVS